MAPRKRIPLQVLMNGQRVGRLYSDAGGVLRYRYDKLWLDAENRRPLSLSMPLRSQDYSGSVVEHYFDNLLPDSQSIRARLQARLGAESPRCFDLLSHIGRDCIGALQLLPEGDRTNVQTIEAAELSDAEIAEMLRSLQAVPLGIDPEAEFRISVAGVQEKTALLFLNGKWHRPRGATPTSHLFKLPIGELGRTGIDLSDSVENEYLCHQILARFGLPVAHVEIHSFDGVKALVVERFDRRWAADRSWLIRLPQEDICQATGTSAGLKYEADGGPGMKHIMDILLGSVEAQEDRARFMKSQLLFWMLAAIDGHAKNFSIFHHAGGLYRLTPLYDVMSVYPIVAAKQLDRQKIRMAMAVHGKNRHYRWDTISRRHWLESARACRFDPDEMERIVESCCDMLEEVIENVGQEIPDSFPEALADAVFSGLRHARERLVRSEGQ